jgi:hypothetical protein
MQFVIGGGICRFGFKGQGLTVLAESGRGQDITDDADGESLFRYVP